MGSSAARNFNPSRSDTVIIHYSFFGFQYSFFAGCRGRQPLQRGVGSRAAEGVGPYGA